MFRSAFVAIIAMIFVAPVLAEDAARQVLIQCKFIHLRGEAEGEKLLSDPDAMVHGHGDVELLTDAELHVTSATLALHQDHLSIALPGPSNTATYDPSSDATTLTGGRGEVIQQIEAPGVTTLLGESASFAIHTEKKIHYFSRENAAWELKVEEVTAPGIEFEMTAAAGKGNRIAIDPFNASLRYFDSRERIPGTTLEAGRPIWCETSMNARFEFVPGRDYYIWLRPRNPHGSVIVRLRVSWVQESAPASGTPPGN